MATVFSASASMKATPEDVAKSQSNGCSPEPVRAASMKATPEDVAKSWRSAYAGVMMPGASMKATPEDVAKVGYCLVRFALLPDGLNEGHARRRGEDSFIFGFIDRSVPTPQ